MIEGDALSQRRVPVPPGYARGAPLPWWLKLGTKLFLAGIGLHGARARALGIAEPSFTTLEPGRLLDAPELWMRHARAALGRTPRSLLELGPGRMVLRAPVLAGLGFGRIWYADPVDSAPTGPAPYAEAAAMARARGVPVPDLSRRERPRRRAGALRRHPAHRRTGGAPSHPRRVGRPGGERGGAGARAARGHWRRCSRSSVG